MGSTWEDVVKAVETLMASFSSDALQGLESADELLESLTRLETHEGRQTTYALVAFAAATIRWASAALDLDEAEILAEIARGVGVGPNEG
jgi:hypothetical protein